MTFHLEYTLSRPPSCPKKPGPPQTTSRPICSGVKTSGDGDYFRRGPVIAGPRAVLSKELKKAGGWSLSPRQTNPSGYNQLIQNLMGK